MLPASTSTTVQTGTMPVQNSTSGYLPINAASNVTPQLTTQNDTSMSTSSSAVLSVTHEASTSTTDASTTQSVVEPATRPVASTYTSNKATARPYTFYLNTLITNVEGYRVKNEAIHK